MTIDRDEIERFLHGQIDAWNAHDRDAFFGFYREFAVNGLRIEYVGKPPREPWEILETMWKDHNATMLLEAVKAIINGDEAACHHRNHIPAAGVMIESIEHYRFGDGTLSIRYFIDN
jgi:hypothetical protein